MRQKTKMKVLIVMVLVVALLLPTGAVMASAPGELTVSEARLFVNGNEVATSQGGNEPFIVGGTTYLSIRALSIALGVDISWRPETSSVYVGDAPETGTLMITAGNVTNAVSVDDVQDIGAPAEFTTEVGDDFVGWTFADVLNHLGVSDTVLAVAEYVVVTAANGTVAAIPAGDALNPENGHIIFEEDRGTVRLIMAQATSRGTWIRDILEIRLEPSVAATHSDIGIVVDGQAVTTRDVLGNIVTPLMVDGVIYLPLRGVAEALGLEVGWDGARNAIYVGEAPEDADADEEAAFTVTIGSESYTVTMSDFEAIGLVDFYAIDRRGGGEVRIDFTGVPIAEILGSLDIELEAIENIMFTAANGNTGDIPVSEALNPEYGFLAVTENGAPLGAWADDGAGPFRLVMAQDSFPQRWLRNVVDIEVDLGDAPAGISITGTNGVTSTVTVEDIMELGAREVTATIRGTERNFTGVPLIEVLRLADTQYSGGDTVILRALDGFSAILLIDEVIDETNAHLVWLEDDEAVTTDEDVPFMLVVAKDVVPMRFARYISEISVLLPAAEMEVPDFGDYEFVIVAGGQTHVVTMADFVSLEPIIFYASIRGGEQVQFTGLSLVTLLQYLDIDYEDFTTVISTAADNVSMEWTSAEAFDAERGFVAIAEDGEPLDEDVGPFRTVLVGAATNRWLRQLNVITLR